MDYREKSKEELIELLESRDLFIESFLKEQDEGKTLRYAWTGNLGHWYWDVENNIVEFNELKVTNLGYDVSEIPENCGYEFFTDKLHPDDYEGVMQNMRDHLSGKAPVYEVEYRIRTRNNEWRWYHDRGKITQHDKNGKPLFLAGIVFDISEKKGYEERQNVLIQSLSKQLNIQENVFSMIMHDLRSPLTNTIGFTQLFRELIERDKTKEEILEYADIIHTNTNNALTITANLMDWIKVKYNPLEQMADIPLEDAVDDIIRELELEISKKEINIHKEIEKDAFIHTNKGILSISLRNFLSNSIKFTDPRGKITILYKEGLLSITDTGIGIPAEKLAILFNGNVRPSAGTAKEKGSGIGLILVKRLLDEMGIKMEVESFVNRGTTVRLTFPTEK
jgi:PAS domain S-box-containing protein